MLIRATWASAVITINAGVIQRVGPELRAFAANPQDLLSILAHIDRVGPGLEWLEQ
jgi:hypothetical protein